MRYFKIEGIVELDETFFTEDSQDDLLNLVSIGLTEGFCGALHATFGGGIVEVDSEGEVIKTKDV